MKSYFSNLLLALAAIFNSPILRADIVDPTGNDNYKTVMVTIRQLDKKSLQAVPARVRLVFDNQSAERDTSLVNQGQDQQMKLTIPKAATGYFAVEYRAVPTSNQTNETYGTTLSTTLTNGYLESGVKNIEIRLKRIDVNHMVVTRPDGSTYLAKGTVSLSSNWNGSWHETDFFTGLGVDVPVGFIYRAAVSAYTEDGWDKYDAKLDFTNL